MSDEDLLTGLVSGQPQSAAQVQAIVQQLRSKGKLADLAQMSGDPALAPFGARVNATNQQNEVELGRNAMQNRSDDIRQEQYQRMLAQGQGTLAETIRYHNMEDQERRDKLAQQKAAIGDPSQFQSIVDKIGHYDLPAPSMSRSPHTQAVLEALSEQYPNYDVTKFASKQKAQKDFSTGPQGNMVRSAPVSLQHLDLADQKADLLQNTNFPIWNSIRNTAGPLLGNTTIAKGVAGVDTAKSIISDEIDKFFINGGGAEADRKHLQERLANANAPSTIHEVTDTLRQLMAGQMNGLRSQYEDNVGGNFIADKVKHQSVLDTLGWNGETFTGVRGAPKALPGAVGGAPAQGSAPPASAVPSTPGGLPQAPSGPPPGATHSRPSRTQPGKTDYLMPDGTTKTQ